MSRERFYELVPVDDAAYLVTAHFPRLDRADERPFRYFVGTQASLNDIALSSYEQGSSALLCIDTDFLNPTEGSFGWSIAGLDTDAVDASCTVFEHIARNRTIANLAWNDIVALFPAHRHIHYAAAELTSPPPMDCAYGALVALSLMDAQRGGRARVRMLHTMTASLSAHAFFSQDLGVCFWWWSA